MIGPRDPGAQPGDVPPGTIELPSFPLRAYPGLHLPVPFARWIADPDRWNFDICFAQTTSLLLEFGVWLRKMKGIPLLCVNTTHLVAAYDVLLPEKFAKIGAINTVVETLLKKPYERLYGGIYNSGDGLVVLSEGLRDYWRERGVTVPIHVIPRAVQPEIFNQNVASDPYVERFGAEAQVARGPRLVCAGRFTREKAQDRVIRIFAEHILPEEPDATLALIGNGPDGALYRRVAEDLGVSDRVLFTGEVPFTDMARYYAHSDVFLHASLSETFGNVLGEALWCGASTVAFADGMGASSQVQDGVNGVLLAPGNGDTAHEADAAFGRAVVALIRNPERRARLGKAAARLARERAAPEVIQQKIADAFQHAQDHAAASGIRPLADGPRLSRWYTTLRLFWPWASLTTCVCLFGALRSAKPGLKVKKIHPRIA